VAASRLILLMQAHDQDLPFLPACLWEVVLPVVHAAAPAALNLTIKLLEVSLAFWRGFFFD